MSTAFRPILCVIWKTPILKARLKCLLRFGTKRKLSFSSFHLFLQYEQAVRERSLWKPTNKKMQKQHWDSNRKFGPPMYCGLPKIFLTRCRALVMQKKTSNEGKAFHKLLKILGNPFCISQQAFFCLYLKWHHNLRPLRRFAFCINNPPKLANTAASPKKRGENRLSLNVSKLQTLYVVWI